jgi:hypothetical protein
MTRSGKRLNKCEVFWIFCAALGLALGIVNLSFAVGDLGITVETAAGSGKVENCRYCGRPIKLGSIHKDAETVIANQLKQNLTDRGIGSAEGTRKGVHINILIHRYEERQGGNFAVDRPAHVAFHMHLMEGGVVKRLFAYDEYQQSLSQNVLAIGKFLKRGGKWVTAETLCGEGIEAGLNDLLQGIE